MHPKDEYLGIWGFEVDQPSEVWVKSNKSGKVFIKSESQIPEVRSNNKPIKLINENNLIYSCTTVPFHARVLTEPWAEQAVGARVEGGRQLTSSHLSGRAKHVLINRSLQRSGGRGNHFFFPPALPRSTLCGLLWSHTHIYACPHMCNAGS